MERTPEIGLIRRSLGWHHAVFILEATLLSRLGGVAAIIAVYGLTVMVAKTFNWPDEFDSRTAAFSWSLVLLVGVGLDFCLPYVPANSLPWKLYVAYNQSAIASSKSQPSTRIPIGETFRPKALNVPSDATIYPLWLIS